MSAVVGAVAAGAVPPSAHAQTSTPTPAEAPPPPVEPPVDPSGERPTEAPDVPVEPPAAVPDGSTEPPATAPEALLESPDTASGEASGEASTESQPPPTPLVGDFDGDGRADQFWYGPGASPDHVWYGRASRGFSGRPVQVGGNYTPLVGDFTGDGVDDIVWYAPGSAADYLWMGTRRRGFVGRSLTIGGSYQPFVGDFDGDRRDDIFWYSPTGPDRVWYGVAGGGFVGREVSVARSYVPVVGDFDGNGTTDVLWYGPGTARDYLWRGTWSRTFLGVKVNVAGVYTPVVGDFDGDRRDDVYWHRGGPNADVVWKGRPGGRFHGSSASSIGTRPPVVGDFDGNGAADLVWDDVGTANDRVWFGSRNGFAARSVAVAGSYTPTPGDYDGDGRDDIFWFAPGDPKDALWFATANRGFVTRPNTLDPLPGPSVPLRRSTFASQFNPYGYVAHAMGPTPASADTLGRQFGYSNTLEAFQHNYERGFRVFEADWVRLADGTVLAAHDGTEARYGLPPGVKFHQATRGQLSSRYRVGARAATAQSPAVPAASFTPIFAEDIPGLLQAHPDAHLVLDTKADHLAIVRRLVELTTRHAGQTDRLMPHVAGQADLDQMRAIYPIRNYVVALYRSQAFNRFDDDAVVQFVRRNRAPAVMMWWKARKGSLSLRQNMAEQRRYTSSFNSRLRTAGAVTYVHSITDVAAVQSFASRGVGVYSNAPFPPFTERLAPLEPPVGDVPLV